jgi:hypothetical protein
VTIGRDDRWLQPAHLHLLECELIGCQHAKHVGAQSEVRHLNANSFGPSSEGCRTMPGIRVCVSDTRSDRLLLGNYYEPGQTGR